MRAFSFVIIGSVLFLDLVTKQWVMSSGLPYQVNTGGAFSVLVGSAWFSALAVSVFVALVASWAYMRRRSKLSETDELGLTLMVGGALANLLDRWVRGGVVDFIQIWFLPKFNLADMAISLGVLFLLLKLMYRSKTTRVEE